MNTGLARIIHVHYYAILREQSGRSEETRSTEARTALDLFLELNQQHRFTLPPERMKVVVNAEFRDWSAELNHGDTVIFIPPVAGG